MSIMRVVNRPEFLSSVRMKPGDMFDAGSELCVVIDDGFNHGNGVTGSIWHHQTRQATEEERIIYEVMKL